MVPSSVMGQQDGEVTALPLPLTVSIDRPQHMHISSTEIVQVAVSSSIPTLPELSRGAIIMLL